MTMLAEEVTYPLAYHKLCFLWVLKMFPGEHKKALTFLTLYNNEQNLNQIMTSDEIWICHFTPQSKQQSTEWRHTSFPKKQKFRPTM